MKYLLWFSSVFLFIYFSFVTSNNNPVISSGVFYDHFNLLLPQGWAFFTRNPREKVIKPVVHYKKGCSCDGRIVNFTGFQLNKITSRLGTSCNFIFI
ncbi:hypothetical protein EQP59_00080 [Ornithobacterium rhinotracheale]|uniref:Uncharacterized protein n=1 Tax=Ornithobacterium rhinotracheale TaxID=28251 RepID=A0A410JP12_ORNRH|nr:hypothetical protein [Ornithobacterium rhinotracheale]QAR29869.1 hypothetical protein EQP59_00080 [Ornithobacterium rhinotracheale]